MYSNNDIIKKSDEFYNYINSLQGVEALIEMLNNWSSLGCIYIYSGLIRNFFIQDSLKPHDIDIVVSGVNMEQLNIRDFSRNKFGGLKFKAGLYDVDVWKLDDTWGIVKTKMLPTPKSLLDVVFFNYSSIIYDYNNKRFVVGKSFLDFMNRRQIDVVFPLNPLPSLCIINTLHYSLQLNIPVSQKLKLWIKKQNFSPEDFTKIQIEHWGCKLYKFDDLTKLLYV